MLLTSVLSPGDDAALHVLAIALLWQIAPFPKDKCDMAAADG
jgi:hypothetical protein